MRVPTLGRAAPGPQVHCAGVAVGVGLGDPPWTHAKGVGVAVGEGPGAPARLNAPSRNRQPMELVVGTYSLTTQNVWASRGSMSLTVSSAQRLRPVGRP